MPTAMLREPGVINWGTCTIRVTALNTFTDQTILRPEKVDMETYLDKTIGDFASVLDEHVPGWHERITQPLRMSSCELCVLGQVFAPGPVGDRRDGYERGLEFLYARGIDDPNEIFTNPTAVYYWDREIEARRAA